MLSQLSVTRLKLPALLEPDASGQCIQLPWHPNNRLIFIPPYGLNPSSPKLIIPQCMRLLLIRKYVFIHIHMQTHASRVPYGVC